jgi:hypothetical protein
MSIVCPSYSARVMMMEFYAEESYMFPSWWSQNSTLYFQLINGRTNLVGF